MKGRNLRQASDRRFLDDAGKGISHLTWPGGSFSHCGRSARNMQTGLVFNIQKYCLHDGPGIRTTVFLKGCPLCCVWCHNPEGMAPRRELIVLENRCVVCGECRRACPFGATIGGEGMLPAHQEQCTLCAECVAVCPTGARQMVGREITVEEVMAEVLRDRVFYEDSGGGVTFSGGEPLTQLKFVQALLEACRAQGLHTALDTCGFGCTEHLLTLAQLANLVLYDLKVMDDARHRELCGVSNAPILENLRALARVHPHIWIRVPVIPGCNDDEANLEALARFTAGLAGVRQVNLLPFHRAGAQKARRVGQPVHLEATSQPSSQRMEQLAKKFRAVGLEVRVGG
jgi:pyruvate formate lyase activating enzyme